MTEQINEWIEKAESDFRVECREFGLPIEESPNYDAVVFHAQQCVEKLMKALLIARGVVPGKTHDLVGLSHELMRVEPKWSCADQELIELTRIGVGSRYPEVRVDRDIAAGLHNVSVKLRPVLLGLLGRGAES